MIKPKIDSATFEFIQERNADQTAKEIIADFRKSLSPYIVPSIVDLIATDCSIISVDRILKANPTHIDCNGSDLDYGFWMQVRESLMNKK